jgi:hypothetical protein
LIRYSDCHGRNGFVAYELKYSESMREPTPELKPRYDELSDASGLFTEPAVAALRTNPIQQLWREHLLAQTMKPSPKTCRRLLCAVMCGRRSICR